jgi:hypothetical protein
LWKQGHEHVAQDLGRIDRGGDQRDAHAQNRIAIEETSAPAADELDPRLERKLAAKKRSCIAL